MTAIQDGYTRRTVLNHGTLPINVMYRPATRGERAHSRWMLQSLGDNIAANQKVYEFVEQHFVAGGGIFAYGVTTKSLKHYDLNHPQAFKQLVSSIMGTTEDYSGRKWIDDEPLWARNLAEGIALEKSNKKLAERDCKLCQKWWYLETTGEILLNAAGEQQERIGDPPCRTQMGCLKGTPENQKSLNTANKWALRHYLECKAVGQFPEDPVVRRNAVIIERALARKAKAE